MNSHLISWKRTGFVKRKAYSDIHKEGERNTDKLCLTTRAIEKIGFYSSTKSVFQILRLICLSSIKNELQILTNFYCWKTQVGAVVIGSFESLMAKHFLAHPQGPVGLEL